MAKHWTEKEDSFLIYYEDVGPDFVASHDFGRPDGSGSRRIKKLRESGAVLAFWKRELAQMEYHLARGGRYADPEGMKAEIMEKIEQEQSK